MDNNETSLWDSTKNMFGLGSIGDTKKKLEGRYVYGANGLDGNSYGNEFATVTDATGNIRGLTEDETMNLMNSKDNVGTININKTPGSEGLGFSDLATGAKTFGDIAGGVAGLGSIYFANKNFELQKDNQDYLKQREAASDARKAKFAANAGNNASY